MSSSQIEAAINGQSGKITSSLVTTFQATPLPAGSDGMPVQMVLRADRFPGTTPVALNHQGCGLEERPVRFR